jgi:hypothetical protein
MHLLAGRFVTLGGGDQGFLKEGVKTYLMTPMSLLNSPIFFCLYIYSLGVGQTCIKRNNLVLSLQCGCFMTSNWRMKKPFCSGSLEVPYCHPASALSTSIFNYRRFITRGMTVHSSTPPLLVTTSHTHTIDTNNHAPVIDTANGIHFGEARPS